MSMTRAAILERAPSANQVAIDKISAIWDEVVHSIVKEMLEYSARKMGDIHINLREEMALELAKLSLFIARKVVEDRLQGRSIDEINKKTERCYCFSQKGQERISNTARNCAEHIWLKKYQERWEPKTKAAIEREKKPKKQSCL